MQSRFSGPTSNESVRPANGLPNFFSVLLFSRTLIHPLVAAVSTPTGFWSARALFAFESNGGKYARFQREDNRWTDDKRNARGDIVMEGAGFRDRGSILSVGMGRICRARRLVREFIRVAGGFYGFEGQIDVALSAESRPVRVMDCPPFLLSRSPTRPCFANCRDTSVAMRRARGTELGELSRCFY